MVESQPPNNPASGLSSFSGTFVGRQREMGELKAALDDALSGQGRLVMLVGEPGIGKTRTAQELAYHAGTLGAQVFWGRCYEEEGAPPYWPWVQTIRSYIQQQTPERLLAGMGPGAADIAEMVPEIRHKLSDLETPPSLEPEQARFRLFDSITTFWKNVAQSQPLMLVMDDLHWADRSSLLLLEFLAREIQSSPLLVLGTYRDVEVSRRHPLSQTLGSLIREPSFRHVQLGGLSKQDASRLVELSAGVTLAEPSLDLIHSRTEGNPLFLSELVRLVGDESIGADHSWTSALPEGVKDIIGRRLDRLSAPCNETLTVASVIGREFSLEQLNPLIDGMTEDALLEVLEEAQSARVIEESPGSRDGFRFAHALIQETVAAELTTARRVRLHARIGEALEELYAADIEGHASELAHHFTEAEMVLGAEKLVRYSRITGERALATYAWEDAEFYFRRALDARRVSLSGLEPATDAETAELLFGLGRAQAGTLPLYRVPEAIATLHRAFNYYADVLDVDRALAVVHFPIIGIGVGRRSGRAQMLERAMTLVRPESHEEGRLLSNYGAALGLHEGDYDGAQAALNRAINIARREGDAALEMRSLCHAARVDRLQGRIKEALDKNLRALELAPRANDLASEADAHFQAGSHSLLLGDSDTAQYHASAIWAPAEKLGDRFSTLNALMLNIRHSMVVGNWVLAREFTDRGLVVASQDSRLLFYRTMLEYQEGNFVQGGAYVERLQKGMEMTTPGPTLDTVLLALAIVLAAWITGKESV